MTLTESKIKIIKANIRILENHLVKEYSEKTQKKLEKEKRELERLKDTNPEFFI